MEESGSQNNRVTELEHQNEELRRVIRHMRRDIETLGNQVPAAVPSDDKVTVTVNSSSTAAADCGLWCLSGLSLRVHCMQIFTTP